MLERQREGVAKAKAEGKYKARAPTARAKAVTLSGFGPIWTNDQPAKCLKSLAATLAVVGKFR